LNIFLFYLLVSSLIQSPDNAVPDELTVEFIREPKNVEISDPLPEYSWIVPKQAVLQTGFQILVSSSKDKSVKNIADVWDSKHVNTDKSANIEHGSGPLKPNSTYYWKVRIWDQDNLPSDYSSVQTFKTGQFNSTISTKNSFQAEKIAPVVFKQTAAGHYFADFGKDAFGTLQLIYKTRNPETLTIRLGEKIKDGEIDREPGGTIRYQETELKVTPLQTEYLLQLPADKRNTNDQAIPLPDSFGVVMPFRYVEIENAGQQIKMDDIRQKAFFHYFKATESHFNSSDTILNKVWDICKYSMKATSFTGLYIDGDRERIPYEADAYINQLSHYSVDREYAIAKQTIEYFMGHPTWPTEWLLHTAMLIYQDYYYTGDLELVEAYYAEIKNKTLYELAGTDGLITTKNPKITNAYMHKLGFSDSSARLKDIVDWPPGQKDTGWKLATAEGERDGYDLLPVNTVVNCFFYCNMVIMAELASALGKTDDANYFKQMATKVKKAINEKLFDPSRRIYLDGEGSSHSSLHANMMPLAFDLVPEEFMHPVVAFVKSRGMACSVYGAQYLLEGLYKAGEDQYVLDLMRAKHDRSWYNMIKVGSTITMEAWDLKYKPNADWNHAWGAAPANIISRYLWGIQPKTPGFASAIIQPQMADLRNSTIEVPTLHGNIQGSYERVNDDLQKYEIDLPANMSAEFFSKDTIAVAVTLNGEKLNSFSGQILLHAGVNKVEIKRVY
jgi:alpha-L-rhamnosidase